MKKEVEKVSKVEGEKLPGFVTSPDPEEELADCSGSDNCLALQKGRLSSSEIGRN